MRRRFLWGVAVLAAYVVVALWVPGRPSRPLFDAVGPPQAYRWVNPPALYAPTNQKPEGASHELVLFGTVGSDAASIATPDGQAAIVLKEGSFAPRKGEKRVVVKIDPLDPATIGPPPSGLRYDGNAYRFIAAYKSSGAEASLGRPATIVLEFPQVAIHLLRRDGNIWTDLKAKPNTHSLQIIGTSSSLGDFVAAGPPLSTSAPKKKKSSFPAALVISLTAAAAAVVAGLVARTRSRKRRRSAKKQKPPSNR